MLMHVSSTQQGSNLVKLTEPVDSIHSALKHCQECIDNPVLSLVRFESTFEALWTR